MLGLSPMISSKLWSRLHLFTEIEVLRLEAILELCDFCKELRVLDRNGGLVGKDCQSLELFSLNGRRPNIAITPSRSERNFSG